MREHFGEPDGRATQSAAEFEAGLEIIELDVAALQGRTQVACESFTGQKKFLPVLSIFDTRNLSAVMTDQ
jgi:hypothetical protein